MVDHTPKAEPATSETNVPADHSVVHFGPGSRIGDYLLEHELGQGGMAQVFKATDVTLERPVAIKLMHPHLHRLPGFKQRFLREARAVARICHPNVVAIHQAGETRGGQLYMALECVAGRDLATVVEQDGPLPVERALDLLAQCCQGLMALHAAGLIHRDIKPPNIFLTDDGVAKLGDLGLARGDDIDDGLTASGAMLGTPAYMSPEQVQNAAAVDIRSDIHALGATLFSLLTARRPFPATSLVACYYQIANDPPPDLAANEGPDAPEVQAIIDRAMAKDPAERFPDPASMLTAIDPARAETARHEIAKRDIRPATDRVSIPLNWLISATTAAVLLLTLIIFTITSDEAATEASAPTPAGQGPSPLTAVTRMLQSTDDPTSGTAVPTGGIGEADDGSLLWHDATGSLRRGRDDLGPWADLRLQTADGQLVGQRFRLIPAGRFHMGSPSDESGRGYNEIRHEVEITHAFWLAENETSRGLLAAIGGTPMPQAPSMPAIDISWDETQAVIETLDARLGPGITARLPTEAEWELACRAGSDAPFSFGEETGHLIAHGNFADQSSGLEWADEALDDGHPGLAPIRSYAANPWGLHDMHGNVWEWCADVYRKDLGDSLQRDPLILSPGSNRVRRGGSWNEALRYARSASRIGSHPGGTRSPAVGFRLALELAQ